MKRILFLICLLIIYGCTEDINSLPERQIYGTWYCVIEREPADGYPHYLELIIKGDYRAEVRTHLTEFNDYWTEGGGAYSLNDGIMVFDFTIDVPPPHPWWKPASRKFISGQVMPKAYFPTLKIEIESTIGDMTENEIFWFRREHPLLQWAKNRDEE